MKSLEDTIRQLHQKYKNSPNNKIHPRLSDEEHKMLKAILKSKKYFYRLLLKLV